MKPGMGMDPIGLGACLLLTLGFYAAVIWLVRLAW